MKTSRPLRLLTQSVLLLVAITLLANRLPAQSTKRAENDERDKPPIQAPSAPVKPVQNQNRVPDQEQPADSIVSDLGVQNAPVIIAAEAHAGNPYGIGLVSFRMRSGDELIDRTSAILLEEANRRVFYPVITRTAFRTFMQNVAGIGEDHPDDVHNVWFLFKGDEPLDLVLQGSGETKIQVPVEYARSRRYDRYVRQWWQGFTRATSTQIEAGDYPPIVETYLTSMLGNRLGLTVPKQLKGKPDPLFQTFELLFNAESIRLEAIEKSMLLGIDQSEANQPVPTPIQWTPLIVSDLPKDIEIEPIASCVPEECFYLRFGTWQNQVWMQRLMEEYGGNLGRMVQLRGFEYKIQSKFLDQLAIESTDFDQLLGGNLIDDVAVIGSDTYFDDGSAVGVMLHAKDSRLLRGNLASKRNKFVRANKKLGVTLEAVQIGDAMAELLSTPDNRYRSFYVISGDCHLVTTSRKIAERFLEAAQGIGSLGESDEFRFARYNMPLDREDTVFVYASTRFFQQLLTPEYQIELRRRNQIITDMMMLEMAKLVANSEHVPADDSGDLIKTGLLPEGFGFRADAGSFQSAGNTWVDSIRGRRGFFIPIPDLELKSVTADESSWFRGRAAFFSQSIRSLDPMVIAIKRYDFEKKIERVVFDARLAPFGEKKYGWLMSMLGPPLKHEIEASPNDVARLQASIQGGWAYPDIPAHQVFAAVQDELDPRLDLSPTSFFRAVETIKAMPGYVGAWPSPGYLDWLPALGAQPDPLGYTYSRILQLWRLQWEGYSILAFDRERLERLKPDLRVVETERPAQIRLLVKDLVGSQLNAWFNSMDYRRSWQTSIANVRFFNLLTQQFGIPPEVARITAERLLDVDLVCSLDGDYEITELPSGRKLWYSNVWPSFARPLLPADYSAPLLKWFRGLEVEVIKTETQFSVHGFLDIERQTSGTKLPSFEMFGGFGGLFGGSDSKKVQPSRPKEKK